MNSIMTATYWQIGWRIVEREQRGSARASYGEELLNKLSKDLTAMRQFFWAYPTKIQTPSGFLTDHPIVQTTSGLSPISVPFPLSWWHYVRLLTVTDDAARQY